MADPAPREAHPPGMPRWLKLSLVALVAAVLLLALLAALGIGGGHGPGQH